MVRVQPQAHLVQRLCWSLFSFRESVGTIDWKSTAAALLANQV